MFIILIKILIIFIGVIYFAGLLAVWRYENKKVKMHRLVFERIESLTKSGLSMATLHAKIFKIQRDYQRWIEMIDSRQRFVLEKVIFLKKSTLKIKYKNRNCLQF